MAAADLVILSDHIARRGRVGSGAIDIRDGRILAVTDGQYPGPARDVLDAHQLVVLPGLIYSPKTRARVACSKGWKLLERQR